MMSAGVFDLTIEAEATFEMLVTCRDSAHNLRDLTGYSAKMQVRRRPGLLPTGTAYFTLTDGDGLTLGGAAGTIAVLISAERTALVTAKKTFYDIYIVDPGGARERVVKGTVTNDPTVTVF